MHTAFAPQFESLCLTADAPVEGCEEAVAPSNRNVGGENGVGVWTISTRKNDFVRKKVTTMASRNDITRTVVLLS